MFAVNAHTHRPADGEIILTAAGIHPWRADDAAIAGSDALAAALGESLAGAQAVGETGLDYACTASREAQERLFRAHLQLAAERRMPVVIHCVRAFEAVMKILGEYSLPAVVFHGFIGSAEQAARAVRRGYLLSFGVRSLRSPRTVAAMRAVPPQSLLLETDDDPTPVGEVYSRAAALLGTDTSALDAQIYENYKRLTRNG